MTKKNNVIRTLPPRSKVKTADTWDLSRLYGSDDEWEKDLRRFELKTNGYDRFQGQLADSSHSLASALKFDYEIDRLGERLGVYAFLKMSEDQSNSHYQGMIGRYQHAATRAAELASFMRPEILAIPSAKCKSYLNSTSFGQYRLAVQRLLRYKKHTRSKKEEQLLAMQSQMAGAASKSFRQLLDADLKFGLVKDEKGERIELSNATFSQLLYSPKRSVRRTAFNRYYEQFAGHENTLAAMLEGSIQKDIYYARARGYPSALASSLFDDNVPSSVYTNLIASVRRNLSSLHRYYELRRRKMRIKDIHHYDTYVPILSELETRRSWNTTVNLVVESLQPLGRQYCQVVEKGLHGRWCDRYPNRGKQSGAFSCGSFDGDPYILMNYRPKVLDHVFTLAHEAGHSMHSYLSARHQSFPYYNYTIFVAEVASTFNEQLLSNHMMSRARSAKEKAYLINREIDAIRGTIIRQTMFAEFEKITHEMAESGEPLTVKSFQDVYRQLLGAYFGDDFIMDDVLSLECFRIPHFYRAFYVYKYATGMSAAIALSQHVLQGGKKELSDYLGFLKGGCSKFPLDLLRGAGVDMESPQPVDTALQHFERLVDELDELL